jgi:hypothetical protein
LLIYPAGRLDPRAQLFASGVARDPEHTVVVLDLPSDAPAERWSSVVRLLKRQDHSLRLIFGQQNGNTSPAIAQMLADRLRRPLLAPDGPVTLAAGGVLFMPTDRGAGWLTFRPGVPPRWESRRFPRPTWEPEGENGLWYASDVAVAESLPAGVWARPAGDDPRDHRQRLVLGLLFRPDQLTIVLGCPGGPALPLEEVSRLWDTLSAGARKAVRFVQYGPVAVPVNSGGLGQALADQLRVPVTLCTGLPTSRTGFHGFDMYTVKEDGSPGWRPFAREFGHFPRPKGGDGTAVVAPPAPPEIVSHRRPLPGIAETMRGVYQYVYHYAPGAVLEVVRSGLWMRPPEQQGDPGSVRSAPLDPATPVIWYDVSSPTTEQRMRMLAEQARERLEPATRELCRVLPADNRAAEVGPLALPPAGSASATVLTVAMNGLPALPPGLPDTPDVPAAYGVQPPVVGSLPDSHSPMAAAPPPPRPEPASATPGVPPTHARPATRPALPGTPALPELRPPAIRPGPGTVTTNGPTTVPPPPADARLFPEPPHHRTPPSPALPHQLAPAGAPRGQVAQYTTTTPAAVPAPIAEPLPDPHRVIWRAAQAGHHTEAAAMAAAWEEHAQRTTGPDSHEARHWLEIRADLTRRAGDYVQATELCIDVARLLLRHHAPDAPEVGTAVDNAHHCWDRVTDPGEFRRLALGLIALRHAVPGPDGRLLRAARHRLEQLDTAPSPASSAAGGS